MILLAFDTSSRDASIAILCDGEIALEYNFFSRDDLSVLLIPSMEFLLRSLGLAFPQIDMFAVAVGPGLFTGIRVGLATLKGLNFAARKPVVGVNTLEALATKSSDMKKVVVPMIDARKGEIYLGSYRFEEGRIHELIPPCLLKPQDAVPLLEPLAEKIFVGSGAEAYGDLLKQAFPGSRLLYRSNFLASEIGRIALERHRRGQCVTDLQELHPVYIRKPDAKSSRLPQRSDAD